MQMQHVSSPFRAGGAVLGGRASVSEKSEAMKVEYRRRGVAMEECQELLPILIYSPLIHLQGKMHPMLVTGLYAYGNTIVSKLLFELCL